MSTGYLIQSMFELAFIVCLVIGLIFEDRLADWEVRTWRKIKRRVTNAVRHGK